MSPNSMVTNPTRSKSTNVRRHHCSDSDHTPHAHMGQEYKDIFQSSHGAKLGFQSPFFLVLTSEP